MSKLAGIVALLNEERVARLMLHIGGDTATRTTRATTRTTTTSAFDRLLTWLLTKLNNNDDNNDDSANALRAALLATGIDRATVDRVVNNINWQVVSRDFLVVDRIFFSEQCDFPLFLVSFFCHLARCVLNR